MPEPAGVFTFDVEADRKAESLANRFGLPENPEGMHTDTPDRAEQVDQALTVETPADEMGQVRQENAYLKSKLGEQAQQTGERFKQLESQLAVMAQARERAQPVQQPGMSGQIPDFFGDIPDTERFMSASERSRINQLLTMLASATESRLAAVGENAAYVAGKTAAGISDQDEAEIAASDPWVNRLSGQDRVSALRRLAESRQKKKVAPQVAADETARGIARRDAFVESSSRVSSASSNDALEPAANQLLRDMRAGKFKTADAMKEAMRKAGITNVDEYGRRH